MAKRLLLVSGSPRSGKSYLACKLKECYGFHALHVDDVYVGFIREKCPELYFEKLHLFIAPQYRCILKKKKWTLEHLGRNYVEEWEAHLEAQVKEQTECYDDVVVEGDLLSDSKHTLQTHLQDVAQVFCIEVVDGKYRCGGNILTLEQVAALGSDAASAAPASRCGKDR